MASPSRRKGLLMSPLLLLILALFFVNTQAASAALGIDFGTEYIKAAIAKPGSPIEIVLTKDSKRKEAATLAFKPSRAQNKDKDAYPERLYGGDALAVSARYPGDVYPNLKTLLGVTYDNPAVTKYKNRFPGLGLEKVSKEGASSVGFRSANLAKQDVFTVEELLSMEMQNIKINAEASVGKNSLVTDTVITYPAFYTAEEKRALELAAELAGLRVLALISDGQAVGLNYANTRAFDAKKDAEKSEYTVVYDMGAGSTTANVLRLHAKAVKGPGKKNTTVQEVQVVGVGYDRALGGDVLNDLIVDDMVEKFVAQDAMKTMGVEKIHVKKDGKTMARLWKDAERIRQVLSANTQASTNLEGLFYEDRNFKYTLTRADFEKMAEPFASRIPMPLSSALSMAGVDMSDISSVILFGGATRTPFVQSRLESAARDVDKVRSNINADEAAAFGAAFRAATLSASFRLAKDIRLSDVSGFAYTMRWNDGKERSQKIFLETSQTGVEKQVTVKSMSDFNIEFIQSLPGIESTQKVLTVEAANLTKTVNDLKSSYGCLESNITVIFDVRLSPNNGLPEITSATASCQAQKAKEGSVMDNVKGMFGFGKKNDQQPLKDDSANANDVLTEAPLPVDDPTSSASIVIETPSGGDSSNKPSATSAKTAKFTPSTIKIPILLKPIAAGVAPKASVTSVKSRLAAFDSSDRNSMLRSEALNVLEAYTYKARDYLSDESFITYSADAARKELSDQLSKVSDWLYGEGSDAKLSDFQDRLKSLKALVDPVLKRKTESTGRGKAVENLESSLSNASGVIDMIRGQMEEAAKNVASSLSSAASAITESASSIISPAEGDGLEDEPYASIVDLGDAKDKGTTFEVPKQYEYTEADVVSIQGAYDKAKKWLDDKLALQEKLGPYDDPAVLVSELQAQSKKLQDAATDAIMKQIKMQTPPKNKKAKTNKTKSSKNSKATNTETPFASTTVVAEETPVTSMKSRKDEL